MPAFNAVRPIRARNVAGLYRAFWAAPLQAVDMPEFYSNALDALRGNFAVRRIQDNLIESADIGFFFQGVLYGNRGVGKSTEINRLLNRPEIKDRFVVVRMDALEELNPQSFGVVDVLLLLLANLVQTCKEKCDELGIVFHESGLMIDDLQTVLAPFFPELIGKADTSRTTGGAAELSFLGLAKLSVRAEGQRKMEGVPARQTITALAASIERYLDVLRSRLPGYQFLIVGENFDKEQIPPKLLVDTFVNYEGLLRDLRLHLLFTLPVPFVNAYGSELAFRMENRYAVYDVPVYGERHDYDSAGREALQDVIEKRADRAAVFAPDSLPLLLSASGGDLYRLFALIVTASRFARYRAEEDGSESRILREDVEKVVGEQLGIFRNELGTAPNDPDDTPWSAKLQKLRDIYEGRAEARTPPDPTLYQLLRKRAVLFFNGKGRYGVHPMAVEILREQLEGDSSFVYRGGGIYDFEAVRPGS